jgi:hypothetical protein
MTFTLDTRPYKPNRDWLLKAYLCDRCGLKRGRGRQVRPDV